MKVWQAAVAVLRRTGNPAVMWGDEGLLHTIAAELGWKSEGPDTSDRVLAALRQTPGELRVHKSLIRRHWVNVFSLPEASQ